jgi:hypothetical protein
LIYEPLLSPTATQVGAIANATGDLLEDDSILVTLADSRRTTDALKLRLALVTRNQVCGGGHLTTSPAAQAAECCQLDS